MAITEQSAVSDETTVGLSQEELDLPAVLRCPSGHVAHYHVYALDEHHRIPFYVCRACAVIYRYQELARADAESRV